MAKRVAASLLGVLAIVAGLVAFVYAFRGTEDFRNPTVAFRFVVIGELIMFSMAVAALWVGIWLLRFAWSGGSGLSSSWVRPAMLGIGCFFPGCIFSLPLTVLWANHTWPGDSQSVFAAMEASFYVGIGTAIICCIAFLKKHVARHGS
jgi:uncharacterized membrane protein